MCMNLQHTAQRLTPKVITPILRPLHPTPTLLLTITPSALLWAVTMAESKRGKVAKSSNGGKNGSNI